MKILITGANRGIGAALLSDLSNRGHSVLGTARNSDTLLPLDVTDPASHEALALRLKDEPLEAIVVNAGVYLDKHETIQGYPSQMWADSFAVNVTGAFLTVQSLLPNLRLAQSQTGLAKIMLLSSQMASHRRAPGGSYIYRASKAAVLNLGRNLATDLKPEGIAVGIVHPGWVRTDMGGEQAPLSVTDCASGLATQLEKLSIANTGCFDNWQGDPYPY